METRFCTEAWTLAGNRWARCDWQVYKKAAAAAHTHAHMPRAHSVGTMQKSTVHPQRAENNEIDGAKEEEASINVQRHAMAATHPCGSALLPR